MWDFKGKAVLITGGSGALGAAVADSFVKSGASVAVTGRAWPDEGVRNGVLYISADLSSGDTARACSRKVADQFGRLDVLVHAVGGFSGGKRVAETPEETWNRMFDLNLRTANLMFQAALPWIRESPAGRIIAIGARAALQPSPGMAAYAASKAALHELVRCLAAEEIESGVTANVILPSIIDTPANRKAMPSADHSRWVGPGKIAETILWLASESTGETSGALIPVYGKS